MEDLEKNQNPEFDLEDILREFGDEDTPAPAQSGVEAILREFADDPDSVVHIDDDPVSGDTLVLDTAEVNAAVSGDTVRMDAVTDETIRMDAVTEDTVRMDAVTEDTVRMDPITEDTVRIARPITDEVTEDTIRMAPVTDETIRLNTKNLPKSPVRIAQPIREEDEREAFTEGWEPEYEQPMGTYKPAPQIIVHPRSRLRELKRKLVAGPERRYYELSAKGLGRIQIGIFFGILVFLLTGAATVLYALDMVPENRMRLLVFSQCFGLLLSALLGCNQMIDGVAEIFKGRFTLNTLLVFSFLACAADAFFCLQQLRVPCCAAFSLQVTMSLWAAYHRRYTEMGQTDTLRKATHLDGIAPCADYYQRRKGLLRFEGQVEHFMDNYNAPGTPEKVLRWYALAVLLISIGIGVVSYLYYGLHAALQATAAALLTGAPAVAFVSQTRPRAILERRLHKLGTVLCGWQGVKALSGKAVLPITHEDLFPAGTVKMNGVKFFSRRRPDDIVAYCTALITADGGGLVSLFQKVADSRNAPHFDAKDLYAYEGGGLGGTVCGESVLVGSLEFLQNMSVEIPEGIRVHQAVAVAIEGELCGLFAVTHDKARVAAAGLASVCGSRKLSAVVAASDFAMTDSLLRSRFGSAAKTVSYPDQEVRNTLREKKLPEDAVAAIMTTKPGFAPIAYGITGARSLKTASWTGLIISMFGGLLGLAMMLALVLLDAPQMLSPVNMLAYQLVWLLPGWLITGWTRIL